MREIRYAVRACLADLRDAGGPLVLAAVSGGADSLALAAALAAEHPVAGAVIVDHGLQAESAAVAEHAALTCRRLGLDPVDVVRVSVAAAGSGLEGAARDARYRALEDAARRHGAAAVLLGHTRDDQAEQVLLGLARGSGARSLSGMPPARGRFRRPLLGIGRETTRAACVAEGIEFWDDPMNEDPAFTRVRARRAVADLERDLGPGVTAALARTAEQLRADADLLDALAAQARAGLPRAGGWSEWGDSHSQAAHESPGIPVDALVAVARPLRTRVWRTLLIEAGAPAGQLGATHTDACDRLLTDWHGQGPLHLPGDLRVSRREGLVHIGGPGRVE